VLADALRTMAAHPLAGSVLELQRAGIPHMLAGSFASSHHGDPRTTNDIGLVIDPSREALERFVRELDRERFYVSGEAARDAFESRGQFNVVLLDSGWKADLILRKERAFSRAATIVAKLEWARAGESERQLRDVIGILEVSGERLDREYIARWIAELDLQELWQRVQSEAG